MDMILLNHWLASRPESVRRVLDEFKVGTHIDVHGEDHIVFGASEDGWLIVVPCIAVNYVHALANKKYICCDCQRSGRLHLRQPDDTTARLQRLLLGENLVQALIKDEEEGST